jgi:hypothetical protein
MFPQTLITKAVTPIPKTKKQQTNTHESHVSQNSSPRSFHSGSEGSLPDDAAAITTRAPYRKIKNMGTYDKQKHDIIDEKSKNSTTNFFKRFTQQSCW